jgi:hypothetical protein
VVLRAKWEVLFGMRGRSDLAEPGDEKRATAGSSWRVSGLCRSGFGGWVRFRIVVDRVGP